MDKTIPATQAAAVEELFRIARELSHAATQVRPDLASKSYRAGHLIGLLHEVARGTPWPAPKEELK